MEFTDEQETLVKESWEILKQDIPQYSFLFFSTDTDEVPSNNPKLKAHAIKVFKMTCETAIQLREKGEVVVSGTTLKYLGAVHVKNGVIDPHFEVVKEALLRTVKQGVGEEKWSEELGLAWAVAYDQLAAAIKTEMKAEQEVPKGWEKLYVYIISVETGKTIAKSGKAYARNGSCRWSETLSESILVPQDEATKEVGEFPIKLVVAMGSSRSSQLGEATVNLASYIGSKSTAPLALPLKKCIHGTTLQVKIQCSTPRTKHSGEQSKNSDLYKLDGTAEYEEKVERKSDFCDSLSNRSFGSSSGNLDDTTQPEELSRDTSFSASSSRHSLDSIEGSFGRESFSSQNSLNGDVNNQIGRQDSTGSQITSPRSSYSVNDSSRTIHSSNSKISGSGSSLRNNKEELQRVSRTIPSSPLRNIGSPKHGVEDVDVITEELRAQARMSEQNARKLMMEHEKLQQELFEQSKSQESLESELSVSRSECGVLRQEVEQLKIVLEKSKEMRNIQKELEEEIKFQKESNDNLNLQMTKTQESNIELVSILQELEETIEKQKKEIEVLSEKNFEQESHKNLESAIQILEKSLEDKNHEIKMEQSLKAQSLLDCETKWRTLFAEKEEYIVNLEEKLSEALNVERVKEITIDGTDSESSESLMEENAALKLKVQELEKDCNELTDENLDLLLKIKDSSKDLPTHVSSSSSNNFSRDFPDNGDESEISKLKSQICELQDALDKNRILADEHSSNHIQMQFADLESKYAELENQLQDLKDKKNHLETKCAELESQLQDIKEKENYLDRELHKYRAKADEQEIEIASLHEQLQCYHEREKAGNQEMRDLLSKLHEDMQLSLAHLKNQQPTLHLPATNGFCSQPHESELLQCTDLTSHKILAEAILNNFNELKNLYEAIVPACENGTEKVADDQTLEKTLEISNLESDTLLKEEIEYLKQCQRDLETQILNLQKEKSQIEINMEILRDEGNISSQSLTDLKTEFTALSLNMDSQVSANKVLEKKSLELEWCKKELEIHLSEIEGENVQLADRINGLEAQLRYLTDAKESSRLELETSESRFELLQNEMRRLETEMDEKSVEMKQKVQEIERHWFESQENVNYLKAANLKLQMTAENLMEECSLLQKSNLELRNKKLELQQNCSTLETELRETEKLYSNILQEFEAFETKYAFMVENVDSKERAFKFELDVLLQENKDQYEKLVADNTRLNHMYLEKTTEAEYLQTIVSRLMEQISTSNDDDTQKMCSEALLEVSKLRAEKAILQASLREIQQKFISCEKDINTIQIESEKRVMQIMGELAAFKQKQEILLADNEKLLELLEEVKRSEQKLKSIIRGVNLKLQASENEKLELAEEISSVKVQLQKLSAMQDEILTLNRSLNEAELEKERLQISLELISGDYKELKDEKVNLVEKILSVQISLSEFEECRRRKFELEEKVLRLEGDLTAREAACFQESTLKNELAQTKRDYRLCQRQIKYLEEEKDEFLKRAQMIEEKKVGETTRQSSEVSVGEDRPLINANEVHDRHITEAPQETGTDVLSKIRFLETELSEALETNDMYKAQLKSLLSTAQASISDSPRTLTHADQVDRQPETECKT
ncbi:hypothetical protein ACFE04_001042 [Oxalis oulophora]